MGFAGSLEGASIKPTAGNQYHMLHEILWSTFYVRRAVLGQKLFGVMEERLHSSESLMAGYRTLRGQEQPTTPTRTALRVTWLNYVWCHKLFNKADCIIPCLM